MRIAIDCRKWNDFGIGRYIRGLVGGLSRVDGDEDYLLIVPENASGLPESARFRTVIERSGKYSVRELFAISSVVKRERANLLHAPHYVTPLSSLPVVVTIHDLIHLRLQGAVNAHKRAYARLMLHRAVSREAVLAVSHAVGDDIARSFPKAAGKIHTTHNGVDAVFFEVEATRRRGKFFLYVGNDKPHKNLDRVVQSFQTFRAVRSDWNLVIVGARAERFEKLGGVVMTGFVSDVELSGLYRDAAALLLVSLDEGFGLPAAEAMAAATPVIGSRIAALTEITAGAALLVDPLRREEIVAAMERIASDAALAQDLAERGRARARDFTWERCARETVAVYRTLGS